jgi:hypothetical protein
VGVVRLGRADNAGEGGYGEGFGGGARVGFSEDVGEEGGIGGVIAGC